MKCYKMLQRCICCYCLNSKVPTYPMHTNRVMQFIKENSWESVKFAIVVLQKRPDGSNRTGKEFRPYLRRNPKVGVLSKFLDLLMNPYTAEKLITFLPSKSLVEKPSSWIHTLWLKTCRVKDYFHTKDKHLNEDPLTVTSCSAWAPPM